MSLRIRNIVRPLHAPSVNFTKCSSSVSSSSAPSSFAGVAPLVPLNLRSASRTIGSSTESTTRICSSDAHPKSSFRNHIPRSRRRFWSTCCALAKASANFSEGDIASETPVRSAAGTLCAYGSVSARLFMLCAKRNSVEVSRVKRETRSYNNARILSIVIKGEKKRSTWKLTA